MLGRGIKRMYRCWESIMDVGEVNNRDGGYDSDIMALDGYCMNRVFFCALNHLSAQKAESMHLDDVKWDSSCSLEFPRSEPNLLILV